MRAPKRPNPQTPRYLRRGRAIRHLHQSGTYAGGFNKEKAANRKRSIVGRLEIRGATDGRIVRALRSEKYL